MTKSFQASDTEGIARQLASKDAEEQTRHLFQRISLLLRRGNAALILNRPPVHADVEVYGDQD